MFNVTSDFARSFPEFWSAERAFSFQFEKPGVQGDVGSCAVITGILTHLECDFVRFQKPDFKGTSVICLLEG